MDAAELQTTHPGQAASLRDICVRAARETKAENAPLDQPLPGTTAVRQRR